MIYVRLLGGLGNQMFQYATARRLAAKHNTQLVLDTSSYQVKNKDETPRHFEIDCFSIDAIVADTSVLNRLQATREPNPLQKLKHKLIGNPITLIGEEGFPVNSAVMKAADETYLIGYWQSEKYFQDICDIILKDFSFTTKPDAENTKMADQIKDKKATAVSLHVRRGDYVTNQHANTFHGTSPMEYYQKAVDLMAKKVQKPHFFIFSDDPAWTQENLKTGHPTTYVTNNDGDKGFEDMRLMMQCQHHIIANSSFSWWGAWLNPSTEKIVMAPKTWFLDPSVDTRDIYAEGWIKV